MRTRLVAILGGLVIVAAGLAGCTSSKDDTTEGASTSTESAAEGATNSGRLTVVAILGPLDDPFFPPLHQGLVDATDDLNIELKYLSAPEDDSFATAYAKLIEQAIAMKPDGLIVGDYIPSSFDPLLKDAVAAGIPVIIDQSGQDSWESVGAIGYVGQDVTKLGEPAAAAFTEAGATNVLCVNKGAGNPYLEAICTSLGEAMDAAGGKSTMYAIPLEDSTNPATESRDIAAQLQSHPEYDAVFTQGAGDAVAPADAIDSLGKTGDIALGTLALNSQVLTSIKDGTLTFALDEQPYLDGYYAGVMMAHYVRFGLLPTYPMYLGYVTVDQSNVDQVIAVQEENPGIRGAS